MRPGRNRLRDVFLDEDERALFPDWNRETVVMVAAFRASLGTDLDAPRVTSLVDEMSQASERFREIWARHDVVALAGGVAGWEHPQLGPLELRREKLAIGDSDGQLLVIYHAESGSDSARALDLLKSRSEPAPASDPVSSGEAALTDF